MGRSAPPNSHQEKHLPTHCWMPRKSIGYIKYFTFFTRFVSPPRATRPHGHTKPRQHWIKTRPSVYYLLASGRRSNSKSGSSKSGFAAHPPLALRTGVCIAAGCRGIHLRPVRDLAAASKRRDRLRLFPKWISQRQRQQAWRSSRTRSGGLVHSHRC